jgi:hypothetical protein
MIPTAAATTFHVVDLATEASASSNQLPPDAVFGGQSFRQLVGTLPSGPQTFWGVPFHLAGDADPRWLWLGERRPAHRVPVDAAAADYVLVAHFCLPTIDAPDAAGAAAPSGKVLRPGELLARYRIELESGGTIEVPIRRRFEVNDGYLDYGYPAFAARPHRPPVLLDWRGPHSDQQWGRNQQTADGSPYGRWLEWRANYWIHAIATPAPGDRITGIVLEGVAGWIGVGGITLFSGPGHPLRHGPLETVRITSSDPLPADPDAVSVDLGLLGHRRSTIPTDPGAWLAAEVQGWGEAPAQARADGLVVEVATSPAATLTVGDARVPLQTLLAEGSAHSEDGRVRVELLPRPDNWVRFTIRDRATGQPTPARVHLRTADGRYLPPYGHRHEVNDRWFEDYGADVLLGSTPYAYVSGSFDAELPSGEVLIEVAKGFDFRPVRRSIAVEPGQRKVVVEIDRARDHRSAGWITADTHVHFLSPQTAHLEAAAEDINVVNLLATQWGDLFTNVGDYTGAASGSSTAETVVWVGTENRQHFLGHMNLLGTQGQTVGRMCAGGPPESFFGDPLHTTLSEWADRGHAEHGLVVIPHFPVPYAEVVADVALGKVDGVEIRDFADGVDSVAVREWYRLLNVGFRVAAVGGTDKMSAGMPLGGVRTYTRIDDGAVSFEAWARGVRAGKTITSTGPFIDLHVEGLEIGDELEMTGNGGQVYVQAIASAWQPLRRLEIVHNGRVVDAAVPGDDPYRIELSTSVHIERDGWIAARCDGLDTLWHSWPMRSAAHTSPIYVGGPRRREAPADLTFLQTVVEGGLTWLDTLATPADPGTHQRLRKVFTEAQRVLAGDTVRS